MCATRREGSAGRLREDLVDVELRPLAWPGALFVLARDQLADQPEREELQADDDEQDAEDQQRPAADRLAADLEHGQVEQDRDAERSEAEPEPAKEVERPVAVAPD